MGVAAASCYGTLTKICISYVLIPHSIPTRLELLLSTFSVKKQKEEKKKWVNKLCKC